MYTVLTLLRLTLSNIYLPKPMSRGERRLEKLGLCSLDGIVEGVIAKQNYVI